MIPCKNGCPHYCEGCHKTCARWKTIQAQNELDRRRRKAYMDYYTQLCTTIVRQCRATLPHQVR